MIVHTGEALIDFFSTALTNGKLAFVPVPGGSPYSTAVATARLGVPSAFLGKISDDFFGDTLVSTLLTNGVDTRFVLRGPEPTTLAFVRSTRSRDVEYAFFANSAADRAFLPEEIPSLPPEVTAIQFGSISLIGDPVGTSVLELVRRERGRRVLSFDPNIRANLVEDETAYRRRLAEAVSLSTVIKISDEDLAWMSTGVSQEDAVTELLKAGVQLVVVTAGADGATAYTASEEVRVAARQVAVVDTVGAGDSFHGGILAWLHTAGRLDNNTIGKLSTAELAEMLAYAASVSAITCSRAGNDPPRADELPRQ
ncbi:MAG: carbohydrate kinase [Spirochaeta sp.]|jgi:fructokinase|nr:carbohydrate kinase [Spirochaeta sp.]